MSYHWKDGGGGGGDEKGISSVLLRWLRNLCNHSTAQTLSSFSSLHKSSWLASRSITPSILSNYRASELLNEIEQNPAVRLIGLRDVFIALHFIDSQRNKIYVYTYIYIHIYIYIYIYIVNECHVKVGKMSYLLMQLLL